MPEESHGRDKKRPKEGVIVLPPPTDIEVRAAVGEMGVVGGEQGRELSLHCPPASRQPEHATRVERVQGHGGPTGQGRTEVNKHGGPQGVEQPGDGQQGQDGQRQHIDTLLRIYRAVSARGMYNFQGARIRVPSGLHIHKWRHYLVDYHDPTVVDYLNFGWPINFNRASPLRSTPENHASATQHMQHIDHYVQVERGHGALLGPLGGHLAGRTHISPLMTKPKKESIHRRVIMDLSWPAQASVNDGVNTESYIDGPATITLPTVDYMCQRLLQLGPGAYMYKTDLARGYRQLRVDPNDWPLLGFTHRGQTFLDICPPFGLRSAAMCMQRTSEAVCFVHAKKGFHSRPYLDDFGGAERDRPTAGKALTTLQGIMGELGLCEAQHKVCLPAQVMPWLGIDFDSVAMTMTIPPAKMIEVGQITQQWQGRRAASQKEMQQLLGLLQFVASVSPPARIFTNRMLECLREAPRRGQETLSLGFRSDLKFFADIWPDYNGVRIMDKGEVECQQLLELDACTTGCGAFTGPEYYAELFPETIRAQEHPIARLELLNVVVAVKVWADGWATKRVKVVCDNMNACLAIQTGRSRDPFMQHCARELFLWCTKFDIELVAEHCPGVLMVRADALSRMLVDKTYERVVQTDELLQNARRIRVPAGYFELVSEL